MSQDVSVRGADDLLRVSKALKAAGQTELRKELNKGLRAAAKPLLKVAKDAARSSYPKRGGLNEFMAKKRGKVAVKTGRDPGVTVAIAKADQRLDTQGRLVHPVFGRPGSRVVQTVRAGVYSGALERSAPDVRDALVEVIDEFSDKLAKG